MRTQQTIDQVMQKTQRYWYEDGISDVGMGAWLLLLGVLFAAEALTPQGSPLWAVWGVGWPIALVGTSFIVGWAIKRAKARLTYPRTGFVEYERKGLGRTARLIGLGLVAAALAAGMVLIYRQFTSLSLLFGIVFLGAFSFVSYRVGVWRYLVLGLWGFILGAVIAAVSLSLEQSSALFYFGTGVGMIVSGVVTYRRYNQTAPLPQEKENGANR